MIEKEKPLTRIAETFSNWVEKGFNLEAVAVYGGSEELLRRMLVSNLIPSFSGEKTIYQRWLTAKGKHLYYLLPFFERIPPGQEKLRQNILASYQADFSRVKPQGVNWEEEVLKTMSLGKQLLKARYYALRKAIRDSFWTLTGILAAEDEVFTLAKNFAPLEFDFYRAKILARLAQGVTDWDVTEDLDPDEEKIKEIKKRFQPEELKKILSTCLEQRGVLFFFNQGVYNYLTLVGGEETSEIVILTDKPLPLRVISGIEILSGSSFSQRLEKFAC